MSLREFFVLFLVCLFWGLHFPVLKLASGDVIDPLFYAAIRMTLIALVLIPFLKWHSGQMKRVVLGGLGFGALNYAFLFPAMGMTTASAGAVAVESYMPISILLSVIFLGERIGLWKIFACMVAFSGVVLIGTTKGGGDLGPLFGLGIALVVCAATCEAIGAVVVKGVTDIKPLELLAWFAVVGTVVLWPLTLTLESDQFAAFAPGNRLKVAAAILYSTIFVSLVAHGLYYWLLQRLPMHTLAPSGLMTSLIGATAGILLLGEALTPRLILGGAMVLGGITLILWREQVHKRADSKADNKIVTPTP